MRNLLALVGALVVGFAALGWYLGWYKLGVESNAPGHPKFNVEVETGKITEDGKNLEKKVNGMIDKKFDGQTTSLPSIPDGIPNIIPPASTLPPPPAVSSTILNPDGSLKIPPPPNFSN